MLDLAQVCDLLCPVPKAFGAAVPVMLSRVLRMTAGHLRKFATCAYHVIPSYPE